MSEASVRVPHLYLYREKFPNLTLINTQKPTDMNLFYTDAVTIVRKKGDEYVREEINTAPVLSGGSSDADALRRNVISRLRKDPTVVLVLEEQGEGCFEDFRATHDFSFLVGIQKEGDNAIGKLTVRYKDAVASEYEYAVDLDDEERNLIVDMTDDIIDLLSCIDGGDYSFIDESSPIYAELNPGEEEDVDDLELYEANRILEDEGFEVEVINTNAHISGAMLFVHENEVLLLGTRHLDGCSFFVEMKRLFTGVMQEEVASAVESVRKDFPFVRMRQLVDSSWSFRIDMDMDTNKKNFVANLLDDIRQLREVVGKVEAAEGIGPEIWSIMQQQRHLFIYEVIDASVRIQNLPM